ncbi:MAG: RHS repeat domain-containing protein [Polyangiaceae bacterium]
MTDPINRQFTYGYATNGIDLTSVTNTTAGRTDALATYAYNPNHTVKTYIRANGGWTSYLYNDAGQVTSVTPPPPLACLTCVDDTSFLFIYDSTGHFETLESRTLFVGTVVLFSATPDAVGRIGTTTDGAGDTRSYFYDNADRLTEIELADGTNVQFGYTNPATSMPDLDMTSFTARLGKVI